MAGYETIVTEVQGRVGLITLNRPKALNALNASVINEVAGPLAHFDADEASLASFPASAVRSGWRARSSRRMPLR